MTTDNRSEIARIEDLVRLGMLDAAEQAASDLTIRAPQDDKAWAWLGMLKLVRHPGVEAEAAIRRALTIFSGNARYWNSLSLALRLQSRFAEAEKAARQALALED